MATQAQITNFFNKLGPIAVQVCNERGYGNAQVWTCMAQAACESAYGQSKIMANAHAYFGIKADKGWVNAAKYGGLVYNSGTKECYDGKTYTNITACFRAYKTDIDSIRDYFDLIACNRYKASLTKTSVLDCITCIKNGGYATDPKYINTICSIYNANKALIESFKVNSIMPTTPIEPKPQPKPATNESIYQVKVNPGSFLRVRTLPNTTTGKEIGRLGNKTQFPVTTIQNGWGYSPKYNGWLCLTYADKVK